MANLKSESQKIKIQFLPSGKSTFVTSGTLILDAAVEAGVIIDAPCGGQGRCGRCLVRVESGEVVRQQNPHLTSKQVEQGWILSCITQVAGNLVLTVPLQKEREKVAVHTASTLTAAAVRCRWPRHPSVRRFYVELPPPSLEDNASDLERLKETLAAGQGINEVHVDLPLIRNLSKVLRQADWRVTVTLDAQDRSGAARLIDVRKGQVKGSLLGLAVDLGTTNVVADLVDMTSGRSLSRVSTLNRQVARGEDVISRAIYSQKDKGLEELHQLAVDTVNDLIADLAGKHKFVPEEIHGMVVAGNTIMTHLFLGLPPRYLREEPYVPTATYFPLYTAAEVGININPHASVCCLPCVAAYVGGDITAGVLSSCLFKSDKLTLFLDVGTNGEIVMGNSDWMTTCACSAGPAFEGAGIRSGMRATKGAIEDVTINSSTLEPTLRVIGSGAPLGICGSGLLSVLAEMLLTGVVDKSGHIGASFAKSKMQGQSRVRRGDHGAEYILAWGSESESGQDIVITEVDINYLLRTKAAIYAGIAVMARTVGVPLGEIEEVLIGGAFGQHINVEKAIQIGLLPDLPWDRFRFLGNTSLSGTFNVLLSEHARMQADEVVRGLTYFELIADSSFMDEFTAGIFLPHTEMHRFPSVAAAIEREGTEVEVG